MEYGIQALAKLAGISCRALRYYDEIGLLSPRRQRGNGYRAYGQREVDLLQQILFYRELGVPLLEIKRIVRAGEYDGLAALEGHLSALRAKKDQLEGLIANVERTIQATKGEVKMSDKEKFEGFKRELIEENERQYGKEIRERYGEADVEASNAKLMGLTAEQYERAQQLSRTINERLKAAMEQGDPAGALAQEACALHREWLGYFWNHYSKEAHLGLARMYVDDPRFTAYYDAIAEGAASFLRNALEIYCR